MAISSTVHKRRASACSDDAPQTKKTKTESKTDADADAVPSASPNSKPVTTPHKEDGDAEHPARNEVVADSRSAVKVEHDTDEQAPQVPQERVFLLWADALISVLDGDGMEQALVCEKTNVQARWPPIRAAKGTPDAWSVFTENAGEVAQWYVDVPEEAAETVQAKALRDAWDVQRRGTEAEREEEEEEGDAVKEEKGWWYEITAQRDEPVGDVPKLEVELKVIFSGVEGNGDGVWWFTQIKETDRETARAMAEMGEWLIERVC